MININNTKKGFTLILACLVTSIILSVALGIYNIILREIEFSGIGRESQIAFHSADSGVECAMYWDIKKGLISSTTVNAIECMSQNFNVGGMPVISFTLNNFGNGSCAKIDIDKSSPITIITSNGYNVDCGANSPRKVNRALQVAY